MLKEGTFEWADSLMMQGIRMRRRNWGSGWTMHRVKDTSAIVTTRFYGDGTTASAPDAFKREDIRSTDWEPYYAFELGEL